MANTIFFSWQADHPSEVCKSVIELALQKALDVLYQSMPIKESERNEFQIDKDTKGMPGMPEIVATIFRKIDAATMFVADLTFVGKRADGRPTPNPNVLIEYGWALRALGFGRMLAVMNSAYGETTAESMPFDMKHLRFPIVYNCAANASPSVINAEVEKLATAFVEAIGNILGSDEFKEGSSKTSERPKFVPLSPKDGMARFREQGESLGVQSSDVLNSFAESLPKPVTLREGSAFWLRVMPVYAPERTWSQPQIMEVVRNSRRILLPLGEGYRNFEFFRAGDGAGTYAKPFSGEEETRAAIMVFKTGEVWTIDTYPAQVISKDQRSILYPPQYFVHALESIVDFMRRLGVDGKLRWQAGLEGIKHLRMKTPSGRSVGHFLNDTVTKDGTLLDGEPPEVNLKPFFDEIFAEAGIAPVAEY
jgi:hypothetical protein